VLQATEGGEDPTRSPAGRKISAARVCATIAARQRGVVSREQLLSAGLSPAVITGLIRAGHLHRLHRGVYAVGHPVLPAFGREQAAVLACGSGAVLSGRSALYVWGILPTASGEVEIAVPGRHCRKQRGIRTHRVETLDVRDVRTRHGLRVVFPARALVDFAATASWDELGDAVAEARSNKLVRGGELEAAAAAAGKRRGGARMRAFLDDEREPGITRSRAERRFRKLLQDAGFPQPKTNVLIAGRNADFVWEAEKVILEVDGWRWHSHRRAFENDRKKAMAFADAGYHVIRVTWRQFTREPLALIAHIARIIDRRSRARH
jgi:very-short-patch-repair endonuclease